MTRDIIEDDKPTDPTGGANDIGGTDQQKQKQEEDITIALQTSAIPDEDALTMPKKISDAPVSSIDTYSNAAARDIGSHHNNVSSATLMAVNASLTIQKLLVVKDILMQVGMKQANASALSFAPPWILEDAYNIERKDNWPGAYDEI